MWYIIHSRELDIGERLSCLSSGEYTCTLHGHKYRGLQCDSGVIEQETCDVIIFRGRSTCCVPAHLIISDSDHR